MDAQTRVAPLMSTPDMLILMVRVATFKGTVSEISSDPPRKEGNARDVQRHSLKPLCVRRA